MRSRVTIPIAVIAAAVIVGLAVYSFEKGLHPGSAVVPLSKLSLVRPVDATDHVLGNPAAPVVFVEYADIDCPFCKQFHTTLEDMIATYGPTGQVAWVFRHLPITDLHPYAEQHAEAAECAAQVGGSQAFWTFIDALHAAAPGANQFDPSGYDTVITHMGLSLQAFKSCMADGTYKARVQADYDNAIATGADGTPYTIVLVKGQDPLPINGAISDESLKGVIDEALIEAGR